MQSVQKTVGAVLSALLLGACALPFGSAQVAQSNANDAVRLNEVIALGTNGMLLKNILRARDRQPRFYSRIREVSAQRTVETSGEIGLTIPFGGASSPSYEGAPSLSQTANVNPSFEIEAQNTKDTALPFYTPVPAELLTGFVGEGWPVDVVALLLVESVTFRKDGSDIGRLHNTGKHINSECDSWANNNIAFQKFVTELATDNGKLVSFKNACAFVGWVQQLKRRSIAQAKKDELELSVDTRVACNSPGPEFLLSQDPVEDILKARKAGYAIKPVPKNKKKFQLCSTATEQSLNLEDAGVSGFDVTAKLRSIDDAIYYLGALSRTSKDVATEISSASIVYRPDSLKGDRDFVPLFRMTTKPSGEVQYAARADHGNKTYYASTNDTDDRSGTVLTILNQLKVLVQEPGALSSTQNVRVLGGR